MKKIGKPFSKIRQRVFVARMEWEIFNKILPHLIQPANDDLPFDSREDILRINVRARLQISLDLDLIQRASARMPKVYCDAFRYIAYRDLAKHMEMFLELAEKRIQPDV